MNRVFDFVYFYHFTFDYREPFVRDYLNELRVRKPVIFSGDLNVAHADLDVYNFHAKHLLKQAGTTLREKNAFSTFLSTGFYDSLRYFYPCKYGSRILFFNYTILQLGLKYQYLVFKVNASLECFSFTFFFKRKSSQICFLNFFGRISLI